MRVKALKGTAKKQYTLLLPVGSEITDLSEDIQNAIAAFGELKELTQFELEPTNDLHKETIEKMNEQGAHLWKTTVAFSEIR